MIFKHYITQPTVTPADTLKKTINDLAAALKQRQNMDGIKEMEALQILDELLNQTSPEATTTAPNPR